MKHGILHIVSKTQSQILSKLWVDVDHQMSKNSLLLHPDPPDPDPNPLYSACGRVSIGEPISTLQHPDRTDNLSRLQSHFVHLRHD